MWAALRKLDADDRRLVRFFNPVQLICFGGRIGEAFLTDFLRPSQSLACPLDHTNLTVLEAKLVCEKNHEFLIEQGVPVFAGNPRREYEPGNMPACNIAKSSDVDPFVNNWIVNTNGNLYWKVRGKLPRYPIPRWPFSGGEGKTLLDLGCGWGRWCNAAADAGYEPFGVDIHLDALQAATRVAQQRGKNARYFCTDIERVPFKAASMDRVFSYSVLQHLDREKVARILREAWRVLKPGGELSVQLPNSWGLLSLARSLKRGFREAKPGTFEMRYWSRRQIRELVLGAGFQEPKITADGYFSQNPQLADLDLLSATGRIVVRISHAGCVASRKFRPLIGLADSFWVTTQKSGDESR